MNPGTVVFERYELHEQIGAGATGVVWRATHLLLHQTVALKRISFGDLDSAQAQLTRDRALREARLAARLQGHPPPSSCSTSSATASFAHPPAPGHWSRSC